MRKKSLYRLALEWFLAQFKVPFTQAFLDHKEKVGSKLPTHFRISEYQKLCFFWEELGLNLLDLECIEKNYPGWSTDMLEVGLARRNAQADASAQTSASKVQSGSVGRRVIKRKLL